MKLLLGDIVERNISYRIVKSLILVTLVIAGIDFLFLVLNELSGLQKDYKLVDIIYYSFFSMPYRLYDLSSYICLVGIIFGLGSLIDQGEIIGTKILGKSNRDITIAAFRPMIILMLIGLCASEFYIPELSRYAEENKILKKQDFSTTKGYWFATEGRISHISSAPDDRTINGITIYEFESDYLPSIIVRADNATLVANEWLLNDPEINFLNRTSTFQKEEKRFTLDFSDRGLPLLMSPKYLSLSDLYLQMNSTISNYREKTLSLEFWRKILQPLITFSLALLAVAFLFGPMRDQKSGQRLLIGIGVSFGVDLCQKLFGSISVVSDIPTLLAVISPVLLVLFIAYLLFQKTSY